MAKERYPQGKVIDATVEILYPQGAIVSLDVDTLGILTNDVVDKLSLHRNLTVQVAAVGYDEANQWIVVTPATIA